MSIYILQTVLFFCTQDIICATIRHSDFLSLGCNLMIIACNVIIINLNFGGPPQVLGGACIISLSLLFPLIRPRLLMPFRGHVQTQVSAKLENDLMEHGGR